MTRAAEGDDARFSRWVLVAAGLAVLGWAVPALVMLDKGFSVQDEGTYVLAYRWWSSNPYFVPGAQYVYGPIFHALGESIPLLRLVRLLMVLASNAGFASAFLVWLTRRRPGLLPASRPSLVMLLTATGGMSYLWAPLTPGYYDLTADICLLLVALMLLVLARTTGFPWWNPLVSGVACVLLLLSKYTATSAGVLTVAVVVWCLVRRGGARDATSYVVLFAAGVAAALTACQLFVVPLGGFLSTTRQVTRLTAVGGHDLHYLARVNLMSTWHVTLGALMLVLPMVGALVLAIRMSRDGHARGARVVLVAVAALNAVLLPMALGWHGGSDRGGLMVGVAFGSLMVSGIAAVVAGRRLAAAGHEERLVVVVLLLVPLLQAAGTNVNVFYVAGECLAMWAAVPLVLVARPGCSPTLSAAVVIDLVALVVATAMIGGSTTLLSPFKTTPVGQDVVRVPSLGVDLAPGTARRYAVLEGALEPYVDRGRTPIFTLDEKAGLTYLLGGVPVGSTWTDSASPSRTAGILDLACRDGDPVAASRPVLIVDHPVHPLIAAAMRRCGFDYPHAYRRIKLASGPPGIRVFVPRSHS